MPEPKHTNRLIHETSPYLLQHAHNPVDWYPWGEEALRRAKEEDKPILLSVGYSACHWCHVMERESFENEEIASLMNEHFINIKVDREERPDIDHIYMNAVQMMTGQGGWPMTVFLTPDGKPFYGGTYYPPEDRYGRPGFPRILRAVAEAWEKRRAEIESQGATIVKEMARLSGVDMPESPVTPDLLDQAYLHLRQQFDTRFGGFGSAPKFPQPMILDFLLRYHLRSHREEPLKMVELTLEKMAFGGIYDQLGGGFHRYSTDAYWLVPHFEKMLYDNAQLVQTYLHAYQLTGDLLYRRIVEETLEYVLREMTSPQGGFYSSQDADSEGEEGRFFVWTEAEIKEVLGEDDAVLFCRYYDVTARGNWEGRNILNVPVAPEPFARSMGLSPDAFGQKLATMRAKLFARRQQRVKPARDEKIITAWNGLMLAAFAEAAAVLEREDYLHTAIKNAAFVLQELYKEGRLMRTGCAMPISPHQGEAREANAFQLAPIPGFLEDYAFYADGLIRLYEATFDRNWLDAAEQLTDSLVNHFLDPQGGFYMTAAQAEDLVERPKDIADNAVPSGNSVAVDVLLRLATLLGKEHYRKQAATVLRKMNSLLTQHPAVFGRLLCAADFYIGPVRELAIVGPRDSRETRALLRVARQQYHPNLVIALSEPDDSRNTDLPLLASRPQL
ncbi:MAG TPA: thioredoxin domain-containing protein, partial [Chthonomonadales bacterium]|nr:thioredoxin domain-containing protein [Chthonomonadales bacterium]